MRLIFTLATAAALTGSIASAQSPVPIESIASNEELSLLIDSTTASLEKALANEADFEKNKGGKIREAFGMLSVLGQAVAEAKGGTELMINGPALRDAALQYNRKSTYAEAQAALDHVKEVLAGNVSGEHEQLHPWNKLINMHPMMEEMNSANSSILKVLKRIRGKNSDTQGAVTWGLLSIAMKADTHEVKNPDDIPQWNAWSDDFQTAAIKLAEAIRAKDAAEARMWFDKANAACDACHEKFRD